LDYYFDFEGTSLLLFLHFLNRERCLEEKKWVEERNDLKVVLVWLLLLEGGFL